MLPALERRARPLQLFFEVKANLEAQVAAARGGVRRIQPGIESLSDHVLQLMRKGTTALRNVQLLKWCPEYGVTVDWNLLYGFPGETDADYDQILALLPAIRFPAAAGARADPARPLQPVPHAPAAFGLSNVRPMAIYRTLYPFETEALRRIAYYFDFDYAPDVDPTGYAADVIAYAAALAARRRTEAR